MRDAQLRFTDVQINEAVEEILLLFKRDLERARVTLRTDFDRSIPNVEADRVQLQQVVLNLVRNAIDAMAGVNGRSRVLTAASKAADGHVSVAIADTGVGIDLREQGAAVRCALHDQGGGVWASACRFAARSSLSMEDVYGWRKTRRMARRSLSLSRFANPPRCRGATENVVAVVVHIVDDDQAVRESLGDLLRSMDYQVTLYGSASEFLEVELPDTPACLVLDVRLPGTSGLELQEYLTRLNIRLPVILMTGFGDIVMSVKGMKAGAVDFLTKPVRDQDLLDAVAAAIRMDQDRRQEMAQHAQLREKYALLTPRERQVMALVASGLMNKHVASELSISEVTVKMHRASVMRKLGAKIRSDARSDRGGARHPEVRRVPVTSTCDVTAGSRRIV